MKTIIAGGRDINDYRPVMLAIKKAAQGGIVITELVCGMAPGVDTTGFYFAKMARIPIKEFPALWGDITVPGALIKERADGTKYNALAGPMRNKKMAIYADALIAIWDGVSTGTGDMIERMKLGNKPIFIYETAAGLL